MDTRVEPEYDGKGVDISTPEYDHQWNFTKGLDVVCQCAALLERLKTHIKINSLFCHPRAWLLARPEDLDSRVKPENDKDVLKSISPKKNDHNNLRPQCAPDMTRFLSDVYKRSTRAQKTRALETACSEASKVISSGRSMIEMLGVLAIIGVLSVGGIQGFSKAMETYQSHKQLDQINALIYAVLELRDTFKQDYRNQSTTRIKGLMGAISALGLLPDDMKLISNEVANDKYGNGFILSYGVDNCRQPDNTFAPCSGVSFHLQIVLKTINNTFYVSSENQCKNIIKAVSAFDSENSNINRLELRNKEDIKDSRYTIDGLIMGRSRCGQSQSCFKNMTPIKMTQFCKSCTTEDHCVLVLYFIP